MRNSHPAEQSRGLCFDLQLDSLDSVRRRNGVVTGSMLFSQDRGGTFTGSNYLTFPANQQPFSGAGGWSAVIEFYPSFTPTGVGALIWTFFASVNGGGNATKIRISDTDGTMTVFAGASSAAVTSVIGVYLPYWKTNQRNVLAVTTRSGASALWLNGVQIGISAGAWVTQTGYTSIVVGEDTIPNRRFLGSISSVKLFRHASANDLLTAGEALDYWRRSTFNYQSKATCQLTMGAAQHNPVGNAIDALLPDGSMETAGVAAWTPNNATLTKTTSSPHGGTQALRITGTGANAYCVPAVNPIIAGVQYRLTGWARGDGVASPFVQDLITTIWTGTTSTAWQYFDITWTGVANLKLLSQTGQYTDYDDLTLYRYWPMTLDTSGRGNHFMFGDGSTSTTFPAKLSQRGYGFDGGDYFIHGPLPSGTYTVFTVLKLTGVPAGTWQPIFDCRSGTGDGFASHGKNAVPQYSLLSTASTRYVNGFLTNPGTRIGNLMWYCFSGISLIPSTSFLIGADIGLANKAIMEMYYFALYPFALTPTQVLCERNYAFQNLNKT
jgi:hypothetical protein